MVDRKQNVSEVWELHCHEPDRRANKVEEHEAQNDGTEKTNTDRQNGESANVRQKQKRTEGYTQMKGRERPEAEAQKIIQQQDTAK